MRVTGAFAATSASARAGATRVMPCLVCARKATAPVTFAEQEKLNLCLSEEGMQPLVSMHVTRCVRGFDLCGSVPPSSASASLVSLQPAANCRCASVLAALTTATRE